MSSVSTPDAVTTPLVLPGTRAVRWLMGTALLALAVYYFVAIDQGAVSVFGSDTHLHEFIHDGRHLLGFPCH